MAGPLVLEEFADVHFPRDGNETLVELMQLQIDFADLGRASSSVGLPSRVKACCLPW